MYHIRSNVSILCTLKKSMRVFRNEHFVSDLVYPGEQHLMYIVYKYVTSKQHKRTFSKYLFAKTFEGEVKSENCIMYQINIIKAYAQNGVVCSQTYLRT